ncbi:hypothetical protein [Campylobacter corcagiensis]|uniref:DUF2513 domain-containing protein n=1 Tax=Campylobacter corcagiensis TaxID=1448857 RepID=A0A7M1LGZ6_9BACT|nr:hypothetical protein [Campylobacter corcagiensis]QKF64519.1 hypothetical protein CCORG_0653 [Campylobacter corcagiensis]QOQ87304.1 hypothetical protein IMC76_00295 [Campylobacter corcagiensis]
MQNIELFDLYVGKVLTKLYESFPIKCEIYYKSDFLEVDENIMRGTLIWLKDSEFIKYDAIMPNSDLVTGAILSLKGLELLKQKPKTFQKSLGESLKVLANKGLDSAISKISNDILSYSYIFFSKLG